MLFRNDIFTTDKNKYRLLETQVESNRAWVINLDEKNAWPELMAWSDISPFSPFNESGSPPVRQASQAMLERRDASWRRIEPLLSKTPDIFEPTFRNLAVNTRATEMPCSPRTIHKDLRRYWKGGQTPAALLADYDHCGFPGGTSSEYATAGRGRKAIACHPVYQIGKQDVDNMTRTIDAEYLKDKRVTIVAAHQRMLEKRYTMLDGNGKSFILPLGSRPSLRQFSRFLKKKYSIEVRLKAREGKKDFERDHRAKLGTVLKDCLGVGHFYEIDATIIDTYIVSLKNVQIIVGKATFYLIIDRKSRLIVGFYIGFENPSWAGAMEAIRTISADKEEMCARYGVEYNPDDWPAHEVFPKQFIADRGSEMTGGSSNQICDELQVGVTNLPSQRPDWKPIVEGGFKLIHTSIQDTAPGFDPVENATRRRGKNYEKDACLNILELGKIILESIIAHNRRPTKHYELSPDELAAGISPHPIAIWNNDIVKRSGVLNRFSEARVRYALLPKDEASVTEEGIVFRGVYYTCPEAISKGWFISARKKRFRITVSYDNRLVDLIYVHDRLTGSQPFLATLTARSENYRGLSFAEVKVFERLKKAALPEITETRAQIQKEFHEKTALTISRAKGKLQAAGKGISRSSRRADTRVARNSETRAERQVLAPLAPAAKAVEQASESTRNVISLPLKPVLSASPTSAAVPFTGTESSPSIELSVQQKLQEARRRMLNGY